MKRIGILTAGGDTPALNATIHGAVTRANQLKVEVIGLMRGFSSLFNPKVPHVLLNPLFQEIPELDPTRGGTLIGASRDYVDPKDTDVLDQMLDRLRKLKIDGLICVGGDGTLNGLQPLADRLPTVLSPKTIDNDLGLNYPGEPDEWLREEDPATGKYQYRKGISRSVFHFERMVNYVTPGYVTAVFVSAWGVGRVRTTAESHRRIAIVEVMGRHSGYIALGSSYGKPDLILVPEHLLDMDPFVERVKELYALQRNVVIVCGEGIVDSNGNELGAEHASTDPAGNKILSGAAEALRNKLIDRIGNDFFNTFSKGDSAKDVIFTRKVGHTQRGGRPLLFDRYYAAQLGGKTVDLLLEGSNNAIAILQYEKDRGFYVDRFEANQFRDNWGLIHARKMHPSFYDAERLKPSEKGIEYLLPIFTGSIGPDDMEHVRRSLFAPGNLTHAYHSPNVDMSKRLRYLD